MPDDKKPPRLQIVPVPRGFFYVPEGKEAELAGLEKALEGDSVALRLCLERIIPARRERPTPFAMPKLAEAADAHKAMAAIAAARSGPAARREGRK